MIPCRLLLDEGINPNELTDEDLESLLKAEACESFIQNREIFWHRGQEYVIGKDISLETAQVICLAQWVHHDDRLWFAHALFQCCLIAKTYPDLKTYIGEVVKEIAAEIAEIKENEDADT